MTPLRQKDIRRHQQKASKIPGPRYLHRGIHYHQNQKAVSEYKQNSMKKRTDHRDTLVHHQRLNSDLNDIYARTAALHRQNMTREEREEESWKAFERIGGKRPRQHVRYAEHLAKASQQRKEIREALRQEEASQGQLVSSSGRSAVETRHRQRTATLAEHRQQHRRELRRLGNPEGLSSESHQRFDPSTQSLIFSKQLKRRIERDVKQEQRRDAVRHKPRRTSQWDVVERNINRPETAVISDPSSDWHFSQRQTQRKGHRLKGKR